MDKKLIIFLISLGILISYCAISIAYEQKKKASRKCTIVFYEDGLYKYLLKDGKIATGV